MGKEKNNRIELLTMAMDRLQKNISQKNKWMEDDSFKEEFLKREISTGTFNDTFNLLLISQLEVYFNEYSRVINELDDKIIELEKENKKFKKELTKLKSFITNK